MLKSIWDLIGSQCSCCRAGVIRSVEVSESSGDNPSGCVLDQLEFMKRYFKVVTVNSVSLGCGLLWTKQGVGICHLGPTNRASKYVVDLSR